MQADEGPAADCIGSGLPVRAFGLDEIADRWPSLTDRFRTAGYAGVYASPMTFQGSTLGAVNLYAKSSDGFGPDAFPMAQALAAHLAVGIAAGREIDHRGAAILSRTVIGQAEGILMERYKITAEEAFGLLRSASKNTNRKLVSVAEELVRTGELVGQRTPDGQLLRERE